jgi:hypothetical protein
VITVEQAINQLNAWVDAHWLEWAVGRGAWPHRIYLRPPQSNQPNLDLLAVQNWAGQWAAAAEGLAGTVEWTSRRVRGMGSYSWPNRLVIATAHEALAPFPAQQVRFRRIKDRLEQAAAHPAVAWHTPVNAQLAAARAVSDLDDADWSTALRVVDYLAANPVTDMMVRQLPIPGLNTKWIELHANVILALIRPPEAPRNPGNSMAQLQHHIGLRAKESTINVALRCPHLRAMAAGLERFAATITTLNASAIKPRALLITENAELGHTLRIDLDGLAVVYGLGKAASILAGLEWLKTAETIVYWGDIDRAGLQCLAALRRCAPTVTSVLMGLDTLARYQTLSHPTGSQQPSHAVPEGLNPPEIALYEHLNGYQLDTGSDLQLEQEHIPIRDAEAAIAIEVLRTSESRRPLVAEG